MIRLDETKIEAISRRMSSACSAMLAMTVREGVSFWSDRCRLAGDLWLPRDAGEEGLPGLLLVPGRGDTKEHMNVAYAPRFAALGIAVLAFDYRGWGESEGRVTGGQELRQAMNPQASLADVRNAFAFLSGDYRVNDESVGIWSCSLGARHALQVAIEQRACALVIQSGNLAGTRQGTRKEARPRLNLARETDEMASPRAPSAGASPTLARDLDRLIATTLIIDAEEDEYFDASLNGRRLFATIQDQVNATYQTVFARHYDMFMGNAYREAVGLTEKFLRKALVAA